MILVTLGTQDTPFPRLLKRVDELIETLQLKDEVIAQTGFTNYTSNNFQTYTYLPKEDYLKLYNKAEIIICHGGAGSIFEAMKAHKKIIVMPRLAKYKEHNDNHQVELAKKLAEDGYIIYCEDNLIEAYKKALTHNFREYDFTNDIVTRIIEFIK